MAVGGAEVIGGVAAAAAGTPTVVGAGVGSLVVYDGVDTARNGFQEIRADYRAPLGHGVLRSLNPDNPVSVQDQVLQQRLEQAGLTSGNMIAAGAVAVGGAAVRGAQKALAPVARAIGRTADDILASAPVQAMENRARKLAGDIDEKTGHALEKANAPRGAARNNTLTASQGVEITGLYSGDSVKYSVENKTEIVQRWMSNAELEATRKTGLLRGGREGTHYVTNSASSNALRARQRSALPQTPEVRVILEVPAGKFSAPSKVEPAFNMPGGGMERTAIGDIPVKIIKEE